jgi:hypothetical protein
MLKSSRIGCSSPKRYPNPVQFCVRKEKKETLDRPASIQNACVLGYGLAEKRREKPDHIFM